MSNDKHWDALGFKTEDEYEEFHRKMQQERIDEVAKENTSYNPDEDTELIDLVNKLEPMFKTQFDKIKEKRIKETDNETLSIREHLFLDIKSNVTCSTEVFFCLAGIINKIFDFSSPL